MNNCKVGKQVQTIYIFESHIKMFNQRITMPTCLFGIIKIIPIKKELLDLIPVKSYVTMRA